MPGTSREWRDGTTRQTQGDESDENTIRLSPSGHRNVNRVEEILGKWGYTSIVESGVEVGSSKQKVK